MRRATHAGKPGLHVADISIHALHEESDASFDGVERHVRISIHALHEESDYVITQNPDASALFQSTLSMRRATFHRQSMPFQ